MSGVEKYRIEQRGSKWVVLPEQGDGVLGEHDTKEDAEKQLAAIESSKARQTHGAIGSAAHAPGPVEVDRCSKSIAALRKFGGEGLAAAEPSDAWDQVGKFGIARAEVRELRQNVAGMH
jgi:hypothetical protein